MSALILAGLVLWGTIPDDCDPARFFSQPRYVQEYLANSGYLSWWQNCQIQKAGE